MYPKPTAIRVSNLYESPGTFSKKGIALRTEWNGSGKNKKHESGRKAKTDGGNDEAIWKIGKSEMEVLYFKGLLYASVLQPKAKSPASPRPGTI